MSYIIEVRERFGYGETKFETQKLPLESIPAEIANIWPWANENEIESITDLIMNGSHDFSESDLIIGLYDELDPISDDPDFEIVIEYYSEGN